jgi:DNA (cytosine-5)-methyltransferase 1
MRPKLLDLFCGGGGASMGYHRAGFDVTGVDLRPMPRYPFTFVRADALEYLAAHGREFDAIHASPPCQAYSSTTKRNKGGRTHPDLVAPVRRLLETSGRPWVIENVEGSPLVGATRLCGTMFPGLLVKRHRLFEASFAFDPPGPCDHPTAKLYPSGDALASGRSMLSPFVAVWGSGGNKGDKALWSRAMGIDWMTRAEMAQAIPPAYTEYAGRLLMNVLDIDGRAAA